VEFEEPDQVTSIRHAIREICAQFPAEYWRERDSRHEFPWDFYNALAKDGWVGIAIPEEYGGGGGGITAKFLALEAAFFAADRAMQTHGGFAYAREYHVGRYFLESRLMQIAPVPQEMVLNFVAEHVLRLPRSY
jgi:alkylation response protein AidB-like acyl-CoA dehydrogenase